MSINNQQPGANGQAALPAKPQSKMELLTTFLEKETVREQLGKSMDGNIDSFVASIIDLYAGDNYLQNCDPQLVAMQAMKAAVLKLPVIKSMGFAYIVPYKSGEKFIPQLQIGYKGLIQLAIRTNQYKYIHADVVYEGEFRKANKLTGEFDLSGTRTGDTIIGYFAHFEMVNGFSKTLYMTVDQVTYHAKKYSKSFNTASSPWKTEFDAMAKKTVLRGLFSHWGYLSTEMQETFNQEDADVADGVLREFASNGNVKPAGFEAAEVTGTTIHNDPGNIDKDPY